MIKSPSKYYQKPFEKNGQQTISWLTLLFVVLLSLFCFITPNLLLGQLIGDESENGLESVDLDGDGDLDVISLSAVEREFRIFINNNGTFEKKVIQSFPDDGNFNINGVFTVNDFNDDGVPDIVIVLIDASQRYWLVSYINILNSSSTTAENFESNPTQNAQTYTTMSVDGVDYFRRQIIDSDLERIVSIASGDIAADGDMDLIYSHITNVQSLRRAQWRRGSSTGSGASEIFRLDNPTEIQIQSTPAPIGGNINGIRDVYHLRLTDLNGDIYPDLVSYSVGDVFNPPPFNGIDIPAIHTYGYDASPGEFNFLFIEEDIGAFEINNSDGSLNIPNGFEIQDLDGDGDPEMVVVSTNPSTGITNILVAGDNANDNTFADIEIPISLGDYSDFELIDTDNDGVVDQIVVLTNNITSTDTTSTLLTYTFEPSDNDGSGTDAFVLDSQTELDEPAFAVVVVQDENGNSVAVTDSDDTSTLSPPPSTPTHTLGDLIGDESGNGMISIDIDGDGDEDVFSASNRENVLRWFRNDGNSSYTPVTIDTPLVLNGVLTADDFNGDDVIDVAVVVGPDANDEYDIHIYLNTLPQASGSPSPDAGDNFETNLTDDTDYTSINGFRRFIAVTGENRVTSMVTVDLDEDSDRDILYTQFDGNGRTQRLSNLNNSSLDRNRNFNTGRRNRNLIVLRVVDYNNDNREELVYVSEQNGDPRLVVSNRNSSGNFNNSSNSSTIILNESVVETASDLAFVNLDGDTGGDFEILLANTDNSGATSIIIIGDTTNDGTFDDTETSITGISNFVKFTITDLDGEGDNDLSILTTDETASSSQVTNYIFNDNLNNGSGQDAYSAGDIFNLGELSFGLVLVEDNQDIISIITDSDNTSALVEKVGNKLTIDYSQGWNLVSQPGLQVEPINYFETIESPELPQFFELKNGNTFDFAETTQEGVGYWVYYDSDPGAITFTTKIQNKTSVNIIEGWNLVGSGSRKTSIQALYDLYPSVADDGLNIFAYNASTSSFQVLSNSGAPDSLNPGQGYYFEAPTAVNGADINGNKIKVSSDTQLNVNDTIEIPLFVSIGERYEQKLILNYSRDIPIPPSISPKKSWFVDDELNRLYSTIKNSSVLYYESDTIEGVTVRLDTLDRSGYLLIDNIFKLYPGYSINLPYTDLSKNISIEWVFEVEKNDDTIVNVDYSNTQSFETKLNPNYPNPFNPNTTIPYSLSEPQEVVISIYNMNGQRVWVKVMGRQSAGEYSVNWNASNLASGIYLVEMYTSKKVRALQRVTLMK